MLKIIYGMISMNEKELFQFIEDWLSHWTGNRPNELLEFYTEDAIYIDPANKEGLKGKKEIRPYFTKLLGFYQDWVWKPIDVFPTKKGAVVKWICTIPVNGETFEEIGVDIVEITDGKIGVNEVYFDRSHMLEAVEKKRKFQKLRL
ncbi:MAG: nuclear transport factor 2 family protein [Candidatus Lokiarchaeota archaeon]|nr:nuclear transport factor 2 family protein [Candidatus Lokiarchaeota archaeon]